jgi:hypothetical protein
MHNELVCKMLESEFLDRIAAALDVRVQTSVIHDLMSAVEDGTASVVVTDLNDTRRQEIEVEGDGIPRVVLTCDQGGSGSSSLWCSAVCIWWGTRLRIYRGTDDVLINEWDSIAEQLVRVAQESKP